MPENIIFTLRRNKKLSQTELAKLCGVTQQHIHWIETGQKSPSLKVAAKIASALGCTIDELIDNGEKEKPA